jgi:hypothetical protein
MAAMVQWIAALPTPLVALLAAALATVGWIYTARRNRSLSRKQHTFNALLQVSFNPLYHDNMTKIRAYVLQGHLPEEILADEHQAERNALKFVLNHYEFIAAGIRNGDISERLLRDSERGTIVRLFEVAQKYISSLRDERKRQVIYEHLEWLYVRWHEKQPSAWQCIVEWIAQRPLYHDRHKWVAAAILVGAAIALVIIDLHLPGEMFNPSR